MKNRKQEDHTRFEFKTGREGFEWKGPRTEGDPSSNPNNRLRQAVNVRFDGGGLRERPGFEKFNSTVLHHASARIKSIFDLPIASPLRLWLVGDGCPATSSSVGFYVGALDTEQDPEFQPYYYYSSATQQVVIGEFDDYLHILVDNELHRANLVLQPWGTSALPIGGTGTDTPLYTYTGFQGRWLQEKFDTLFVMLANGAGGSKISTWDGITHRDDRTGLQIPACAAEYRIQDGGDALAVGYSTGNLVSLRNSSGTWSDISPGAGTVTANRMVSYKDVLWMTNGDENLFKLEGGTLTRVQPATTGIAAGSATRGLAVLNGYLYMGYTTSGGSARIAKFDGSTWTAIEKNLTTQVAALNALKDLCAYRGYLVAAATTATAGARLYAALASGTSGTYIEITPSALNNGDIDQLLVA